MENRSSGAEHILVKVRTWKRWLMINLCAWPIALDVVVVHYTKVQTRTYDHKTHIANVCVYATNEAKDLRLPPAGKGVPSFLDFIKPTPTE